MEAAVPGGGAGVVTAADPCADLVVSATDVALIMTERFAGTELGAVYVAIAPLAVAVGETVPQGAVAHDTAQVTPWFDASLATVAVKFTDCPGFTVCGVDGETATESAMTV